MWKGKGEKPQCSLTIEKMQNMIGDPVWVETEKGGEWYLVHSFHGPEVYGRCMILTKRTGEKKQFPYAHYGETWRAYSAVLPLDERGK